MCLLAQLQAMCDTMPPGSSVSISVDWLRMQLQNEVTGSTALAPQPQADLTVREVAAIVGRKEGAVRQWIRTGLKGIRLQGYWFTPKEYRVTRAALAEFLEAIRSGSAPTQPHRSGRAANLSSWRQVQRATVGTEGPNGRGSRARKQAAR